MTGLRDSRAARSARAGQVAEELRQRGVRQVALTFVDNAGITRVKTVPLDRLARASEWGVGMSPCFDVFLLDDTMTASRGLGGPDGDLRLVPDPEAVAVLAPLPGWAWAPVDRFTQDGETYGADQRSFAARMVEQARAAGFELSMAFEIEWALGRSTEDGSYVPAVAGPAYGMTRLVDLADFGLGVVDALAAAGVEVEQFHPEYAAGQCEVSVPPTDPVAAADRSVLVRQTVRAVAARQGLRVSYAPSVVAGSVGNGGHVHASLWRDGRNLLAGGDGPYGMTAEGAAFVAGVLDALPALTAIGAPSPASYARLVPSHWAGAYQAWGRETRETALRFVTGMAGSEGRAANLEVKCFDLAANPYLVVGSVIAAGLAGIAAGARLPAETTGDPSTRPDAATARLPQSLDEAADRLEGSAVLREAMGDLLFDAVVAVRRGEAALFADTPAEDVVAATRWIY